MKTTKGKMVALAISGPMVATVLVWFMGDVTLEKRLQDGIAWNAYEMAYLYCSEHGKNGV